MLGLAVASTGLQLPTASQPPSTRRALLSSTAAVAALALPGASFAAVKPCKSGAQNCFSTAGPDKNKISQWVWPSDMSRADATASLKTVLSAYPQAGQDGVDGGGWTLTTDTLADKGFAAFEFKSSGTGNMAKFFNGGKPFVDDLEVQVEDTYVQSSTRTYSSTSTRTPPINALLTYIDQMKCAMRLRANRSLRAAPVRAQVAVRSASRVGDSDFGVNAKRVNYIAKGLREKGWTAAAVASK